MTLSAPTRFSSPRAVRPAAGTVIPLPSTEAAPTQHILSVEFVSPGGRTWQAIGGGDTLPEAIAFARDRGPTDVAWQPISWNDLFGE